MAGRITKSEQQLRPDPKYHDTPDLVHCYEVSKEGALGKKLFQIEGGSDGMAVDVKGNLYTTHRGKVHIFNADGKPCFHGGQGLATVDQELTCPRTGAPIDQFSDKLWRRFVLGPGGSHQAGHVLHDMLGHGDAADQLL